MGEKKGRKKAEKRAFEKSTRHNECTNGGTLDQKSVERGVDEMERLYERKMERQGSTSSIWDDYWGTSIEGTEGRFQQTRPRHQGAGGITSISTSNIVEKSYSALHYQRGYCEIQHIKSK